MDIDKHALGQRFKEWLIKTYGTVAEGARRLNKDPDGLRANYFSGKSAPGAELLAQLQELGCDIIWLLTGKTTEESMREKINKLEGQRNYYKQEYEKLAAQVAELKIEYKPKKGTK